MLRSTHTSLLIPGRLCALGGQLLEARAAAQLRHCRAAVEYCRQPLRIAKLRKQPLQTSGTSQSVSPSTRQLSGAAASQRAKH